MFSARGTRLPDPTDALKEFTDVIKGAVVPIEDSNVNVDGFTPPSINKYMGGALIVLRDLNPPLAPKEIRGRIEGQRHVTVPNTIMHYAEGKDGRDWLLLHTLEPHSHGEDRWITLGLDREAMLLVICHTWREYEDGVIRCRIISARKATKNQARQYRAGRRA